MKLSVKRSLKEKLKQFRRRGFEFLGIDRYSRPALNGIDKKLELYLPYRGGTFIEAGANDGYRQSNTYYFEKFLGWRGILIEPIPELYRKCVIERSNSLVFNVALVPMNYEESYVTMIYCNLMSLVEGALHSSEADWDHIQRGLSAQSIDDTYKVKVKARTLTSILTEVGVEEIDLLSLDVEGYEYDALQGLDLNIHRPKYILVEARFRDDIDTYLSEYEYKAIDEFSRYDILYSTQIPLELRRR